MTVIVAINCTDGVVIAADGMLTTTSGGESITHHTVKKIKFLKENKIFAYSGNLGLGERFEAEADNMSVKSTPKTHPLGYPMLLAQAIIKQFSITGIFNPAIAMTQQEGVNLGTVLAYIYNGKPYCCLFDANIQPRLLDDEFFYVSIGSGHISASPFLRFLVDMFCEKERLNADKQPSVNKQPSVKTGTLLAIWAVQYTIQTNPSGVREPICVGVIENTGSDFRARELDDAEMEGHQEAIADAHVYLKSWEEGIRTGKKPNHVEPIPELKKPKEVEN